MRLRSLALSAALGAALLFSGHAQAIGFKAMQWQNSVIHLQTAWQYAPTRGAGVTVCVVDTGLSPYAADLQHADAGGVNAIDPLTPTNYVDDQGHGSFVASEIAGDGTLLDGVAPNARILTAKVLTADGSGTPGSVSAGILWCAQHGAQVLNMSLGGTGSEYDGMKQAIAFACKADVAIAVASGNDGSRDPTAHPAAISSPCLIAANAVDRNEHLTGFSNWRENKRSVSAPGANIIGDSTDGSVQIDSGTSMAAPLVTGTLALLRGQGLSAREAVRVLLAHAHDAPDRPDSYTRKDWRQLYGAGILDAGAACKAAAATAH